MHTNTNSGTVVIIGGAIIGSFAAWFLRRNGYTGPIKVIERDSSYQRSSTALSAASIRTQFGCAFNVQMSLFGASMIRDIKHWFAADADIGFHERGYLIVGGPNAYAVQAENAARQNALGASIDTLRPDQARQKFPWLNVEDVGVATYGLRNEGWFDAWAWLQLVRKSARAPDAWDDVEPDHYLLEEILWEKLAHRVPSFESIRMLRAWSGHYEVNLLDHNGVVGPHDQIGNFLFATGFSGHGVMHAPAVGRAISEQILHGAQTTLDLSALGFARIRAKRPIEETIVY